MSWQRIFTFQRFEVLVTSEHTIINVRIVVFLCERVEPSTIGIANYNRILGSDDYCRNRSKGPCFM
jgi:hypothetical protein